jgi:hypothetical protein
MFAEVFHSTIKGIHLTLEVKTSFSNYVPATGPTMESSSQKLGVPTNNHHRHRWKKENKKPAHKSYKAKLERLRSTKLTRHDQAVNF